MRACVFGCGMMVLGFWLGWMAKPSGDVGPMGRPSERPAVSLLAEDHPGSLSRSQSGLDKIRAELKRDDRRAFPEILDELIGSDGDRSYDFRILFIHWAKSDHEEALRQLASIPDDQDRRQARFGLFGGWGATDPAAAVEEAQKIGSRDARLEVLAQIGLGAEGGDVDAAVGMLDSLGLQGSERAVMVETLFKSHFDEAPEATLEWVRSLSPTERQALLYQRLGRVIEKSPDLARQLYAENRGMDFGLLNSNALAKALIESDIEAAKAWAEELPAGNMQRDVRHRVISALSERDPQAAAAYISESGLMRMHGDTLVHHWFEQDREALVRWVASQEHQETGRDLERSLAMRWSQDDPAGALEYLAGVGTESERLENSKRVVSSWAELEPALATKYVRGLASSEQAPLISSLVKGLSNVDPGGAAALLDAQLEEPSGATGLVDAADLVAGRWGDLDVEAAGAWAQTLQEGSMRRRVVPTVAHDWVRADLEGASEWIATLDPGVSRDRAVTILVGQLSGPDPEAAFAWALTLENTDHRASKLEDVLTSWRDRDYDAAFQVFQKADLDEETRESLSPRFKK